MTIDNLPQTTGSEVQTFIENTLNQIEEGVKKSGFVIKESVDFDLEVIKKKITLKIKEEENGGSSTKGIQMRGF